MALYPYLIAAHISAVVFLVGGMLAHDRMLAGIANDPQDRQIPVLEQLRRLDRQVTTPALLLTWIFGLSLALWGGWFPDGWLIFKLTFVIALSALHGVQSGRLRRSLRDGASASAIPAGGLVIIGGMLVIAILAVAKPF